MAKFGDKILAWMPVDSLIRSECVQKINFNQGFRLEI